MFYCRVLEKRSAGRGVKTEAKKEVNTMERRYLGQSILEYTVILAAIIAAIVIGARIIGAKVGTSFEEAGTVIDTAAGDFGSIYESSGTTTGTTTGGTTTTAL